MNLSKKVGSQLSAKILSAKHTLGKKRENLLLSMLPRGSAVLSEQEVELLQLASITTGELVSSAPPANPMTAILLPVGHKVLSPNTVESIGHDLILDASHPRMQRVAKSDIRHAAFESLSKELREHFPLIRRPLVHHRPMSLTARAVKKVFDAFFDQPPTPEAKAQRVGLAYNLLGATTSLPDPTQAIFPDPSRRGGMLTHEQLKAAETSYRADFAATTSGLDSPGL